MIILYKDSESRLVSDYPEALAYARAILAIEGKRDYPLKSGSVASASLSAVPGVAKAFKAFMIFAQGDSQVKIRVEKQDGKFTVTRFMDGPVNEAMALKDVQSSHNG